MQFPVALQFKPSRRLRAALVLVHALSALCLLSYLPYWQYGLAAFPVLAFSLVHYWRRIDAPCLMLGKDGGLSWRTATGDDQAGRVLAGSVAFSALVVLRVSLEDEKCTRTLVVLRDSLAPKDYRQFQVWLRWVVPVKPAEASA